MAFNSKRTGRWSPINTKLVKGQTHPLQSPPKTIQLKGHLIDVLGCSPNGKDVLDGVSYADTLRDYFATEYGINNLKVDIFKMAKYNIPSIASPKTKQSSIGSEEEITGCFYSDLLCNIHPADAVDYKISHAKGAVVGTQVWLSDDPYNPKHLANIDHKDTNGRANFNYWIVSVSVQTLLPLGDEPSIIRCELPVVLDATIDHIFDRPRDVLRSPHSERIHDDTDFEFLDIRTGQYMRLSSASEYDLQVFRMNMASYMLSGDTFKWRMVQRQESSVVKEDVIGSVAAPLDTQSIDVLGATITAAIASSHTSIVDAIMTANRTLIENLIERSTEAIAQVTASVASASKEAGLPKLGRERRSPLESEQKPSSHTAICDFCNENIKGIRTCCRDCDDFDTCEACLPRLEQEHPGSHRFFSSASPEAFSDIRISAPGPLHSGVSCDECRVTIRGSRYVCLGCDDYDLCQRCQLRTGHAHSSQHGVSHLFVEVPTPISAEALRAAVTNSKRSHSRHGSVRYGCDSCDDTIRGHRFNSKEDPNFDMCANCYRAVADRKDDGRGFAIISVDAGAELPIDVIWAGVAEPTDNATCSAHVNNRQPSSSNQATESIDLSRRQEREGSVAKQLSEVHKAALELPGATSFSASKGLGTTESISALHRAKTKSKVAIQFLSASAPPSPVVPFEEKQALAMRIACSSDDVIRRVIEELQEAISLEASQSVMDLDTLSVQQFEAIVAIIDTEQTAASLSSATPETGRKSSKVTSAAFSPSSASSVDGDRRTLAADFVADVTMADGSTVASGSTFDKVWKVRNSGTETWPANVSLTMLGGERFGRTVGFTVPVKTPSGRAVHPDEEVSITVPRLRAPNYHGRYQTFWRLEGRPDDASELDAVRFGQQLWIDINVVDAGSSGELRADRIAALSSSANSGAPAALGGSSYFAAPHAPSASSRASSSQRRPATEAGTVISDDNQLSALSSPRTDVSDPFEVADAVSEIGESENEGYEIVYDTSEGRATPEI